MPKSYKDFMLRHVLGGVFHNFWPEEYGSWQNAIDDAFERNSIHILKQVQIEIESLLQASHSDKALRKIITRDLSANYYAPGDNHTYQEWLTKVLGSVHLTVSVVAGIDDSI